MANPPTINYNPRGYEATYDPVSDTCAVAVRGFIDANGRVVERGGPGHLDDKVVNRLMLATNCASLVTGCGDVPPRVRDTFHDALADRRDLIGAPIFRHKPDGDVERRYFSIAYDNAQKVRSNSTVLGINKLLFSLVPSLFAIVDCFSRDKTGAFWLMNLGGPSSIESRTAFGQFLSLAAYILEAGEYIPAGATVRCGIWSGSQFFEAPNDRAAARDAVISHLLKTPF